MVPSVSVEFSTPPSHCDLAHRCVAGCDADPWEEWSLYDLMLNLLLDVLGLMMFDVYFKQTTVNSWTSVTWPFFPEKRIHFCHAKRGRRSCSFIRGASEKVAATQNLGIGVSDMGDVSRSPTPGGGPFSPKRCSMVSVGGMTSLWFLYYGNFTFQFFHVRLTKMAASYTQ